MVSFLLPPSLPTPSLILYVSPPPPRNLSHLLMGTCGHTAAPSANGIGYFHSLPSLFPFSYSLSLRPGMKTVYPGFNQNWEGEIKSR
jgi:hypothetical protein